MQIRTLMVGAALMVGLAGCASTAPTNDGAAESTAAETANEQVAVYKGTLPCRRCTGIDLDVRLKGAEAAPEDQRTFSLDATYRDHPQQPAPEHYEGQWDVLSGTVTDPDATVYELTPSGEGQTYYFLRLDAQTLELVDPQKRRFQNGETLRLERQ
ncbi:MULTISPECIES: copper resistance protein NlpE N-terminal domain-containing protein [Cobetia]|uniref:Copper resistance protein NlpE n=1 Tax=Cobetia crustatorum TaxID=553385 RepID=A0A558HV02_9GAMM|nr:MULTISPECIES: copper resistance protein NlpE N-terminal domain-containing protein [Cobetia]TVU72936.1 copper resistance protein NlpE [Cobetia crustatorum]